MTPPGTVAGVVADAERRVRREVTARTWTLFVDGAPHLLSNLAFERHTTRRRLVSSAQAIQSSSQRDGQRHGHTGMIGRRQIRAVEIDTECRTTGTATETGNIRHGHDMETGNPDCPPAAAWQQMSGWERALNARSRSGRVDGRN